MKKISGLLIILAFVISLFAAVNTSVYAETSDDPVVDACEEHVPELVGVQEATCIEEGYSGDLVCSVCGELLETGEVIPVTAHQFGDWYVVQEPTYDATGIEERECAYCGAKEQRTISALTRTSISDVSVRGLSSSYTYTGYRIKPDILLSYDGTNLTAGKDYSVSFENNKNVGTAKVIIKGVGDYKGTRTLQFTINRRSIATATFPTFAERYYDGTAKTPAFTPKYNGKELIKGTDYTVTYSNNKTPGTATIKVTGKGNFTGTKTLYFTIYRRSIATATFPSFAERYYDGTAKKPTFTPKYNGMELVKGTDYTVAYSNNKNAGTATIKVTGKGNYKGTKTLHFTINRRSIATATFPTFATRTYDGTAKKPTFTPKYNGKKLVKGTDYTVAYSNNKNAGKAKIVVTGKGNYRGTKTLYFTINPKSISGWKYPTFTEKTWDGTAKTPSFTVKDNGVKRTKGTDYTVTYSNNKNVGKGKVVVKGKGNYKGTKTLYFTINPKGTTMKSVSAATKGFTAKWNKQGAKMSSSQVSGYQIQYSTSSSFASDNHTWKVSGAGTLTKKVTGLTGGKKYYVRVRTYKTVEGTTYYSSWSSSKSVTTKKASSGTSGAAASISGGSSGGTSSGSSTTGSSYTGTVYWTPSGGVYHYDRGCPSLSRSKTVYSGTISESGKPRVCERCGY